MWLDVAKCIHILSLNDKTFATRTIHASDQPFIPTYS